MTGREGRFVEARARRVRELASVAGRRSAEVERQVELVVRRLRLAWPYDLEYIAKTLGIADITRKPLGINGRLVDTPAGQAIEIDDALPADVARFVLAHELGHVVLGDARPVSALHGRAADDRTYRDLERLCDEFAAQLLMPTRFVREEFSAQALSLAHAAEVACEHCIDVRLVVARLIDTGIWNARAISWTLALRDPPVVEATWTFPTSTGTPEAWRLKGLTYELASEIARGSCVEFSAEIEFAVDEWYAFEPQALLRASNEMLMVLPLT